MTTRMIEAEARIKKAENRIELLKGQLKEAKEEFDEGVEELRECARALTDEVDRPLLKLFEKADPRQSHEVVFGPNALKAIEPPIDNHDSHPPADTWRDVELSAVDKITDKQLERLYEGGIETVGEFEDYRAHVLRGEKRWPKGIGPSAADSIVEAVLNWLTANRDAVVFSNAKEKSC